MFKIGDKVKWIQRDTIIPHPQGKTDREGNVLPVFGDKEMEGRIIGTVNGKRYQVRPDWAEVVADRICGADYYDKYIKESELSLQ
jgi:hypothetical protein